MANTPKEVTEVKPQNKFMQALTQNVSNLKAARARLLSDSARLVAESRLNDLKAAKASLEMEIEKHSDLAPTEVTSTRFVENFDAKKWVNDLHEMNRKMYDLEIELKIAQDLYDTWFK